MTNAIIVDKILGISKDTLFCQLMFQIKNEDKTHTISTMPIFLLDSNASDGLATIALILNTVGVQSWEDLLNKAVQIDFNKDGIIDTIANILDPQKAIHFTIAMNDTDNIENNSETEKEVLE